MARLDDARMNRPDRHLEHSFALNVAELMPLADKSRKHRFQIKIFTQRMHFGPVIVQRAPARVGMADKFQAEKVLHLALLPIGCWHGVGKGWQFRLLGRNRTPQDEKTLELRDGEDVINIIAS